MHMLSYLGPNLNRSLTMILKIHEEAIKKLLGFYSWYSQLADKQFERESIVEKWKNNITRIKRSRHAFCF